MSKQEKSEGDVQESPQTKMEHHFFISTMSGWVTGSDMITAIRRLVKPAFDVAYLAIWRVPLSEISEYPIENYAPMVDGAELIYLDNGGLREEYIAVASMQGGKTISNKPEAEGE